ncbi:MAG: hypothetical protein M1381_03495 [Deltaproteobacteria bacterium]|nr:hypothetical protein [Deltaproteobacteria bacterium]MCL5792814.1 hypothetical protein [Deltaproteobacteria bacterium]
MNTDVINVKISMNDCGYKILITDELTIHSLIDYIKEMDFRNLIVLINLVVKRLYISTIESALDILKQKKDIIRIE